MGKQLNPSALAKEDDAGVIRRSMDQRWPREGEPVCTVCGRNGAYVCDATDEDVCSIECRDICIERSISKVTVETAQLQQAAAQLLCERLAIRVTHLDGEKRDESCAQASSNSTANRSTPFPLPVVDFSQCERLPDTLLANMKQELYERPTPVQMSTIPCVLEGWNVVVSSPTGTGKTAAYLIPVITQIINQRHLNAPQSGPLAVILAPIRELAMQIEQVAKSLICGIPLMKTALLVGGFPLPSQIYRLRCGVQFIVATPGRFLDIFTSDAITEADKGYMADDILSSIATCVIDEVDMMLDIGFHKQIAEIVGLLSSATQYEQIQMLFFSATISARIEELVKQVLIAQGKPIRCLRIEVNSINEPKSTKECLISSLSGITVNSKVRQQIRWVEENSKKQQLFSFLKGKRQESTLVFVESKIGANLLADAIGKHCCIPSASIHADKPQKARLAILEAFINQEVLVLVSTNVLGRGMDLIQVDNVVVFDFPKKVNEYVHLIGRTGRGQNAHGNVLTMVNTKSQSLFRELLPLLRQMKVSVPKELYDALYSGIAATKSESKSFAIDESRRAYRIRKQMDREFEHDSQEWKQWETQQTTKRMRN